jgi:hypothetical protein
MGNATLQFNLHATICLNSLVVQAHGKQCGVDTQPEHHAAAPDRSLLFRGSGSLPVRCGPPMTTGAATTTPKGDGLIPPLCSVSCLFSVPRGPVPVARQE